MRTHSIYKNETGKQVLAQFYEKYLETFEVDIERSYVETTFGKTHVLMTGPKDGKPLFIFQGGNCINPMTLSWFTPLFNDYRIYAPDTIGDPGFSDETRVSAKDSSFACWISELMNHFQIKKSAFIGPSYGGGIILRLAAFHPEKIACSILVSPAGIQLGSKLEMIRRILIPLLIFKMNHSTAQINKITDIMSDSSMKQLDRDVIVSIFNYVELKQEMPKLTEKKELEQYTSPTLVIAGSKDIFFPAKKIRKVAEDIIPNLTNFHSFDMAHFPSEASLNKINHEIKEFLRLNY